MRESRGIRARVSHRCETIRLADPVGDARGPRKVWCLSAHKEIQGRHPAPARAFPFLPQKPTDPIMRSEASIDLSVVIPAFNESERLHVSLPAIGRYFAEQPFETEIVVVDDGSADRTFEAICDLAALLPVPVTAARYAPNHGKGHALKAGFELTRGRRILFCDADLSTPIDETERLLAVLDERTPVVIGSRKMAGASIEVHQPWIRESMGKVFTALARRLAADVSDTTCGFKAFDGDVGRDLFGRVRIGDWSFDAELLLLARLGGHRIHEVPVRWRDERDTKVRLFRDALQSLLGLMRIRLNVLRGSYRTAVPVRVPLEVRRFEPEDASVKSRQAYS
jgi:dolichyl-phosphate beta-glucosyltransferase